jgi:hypothetical protein
MSARSLYEKKCHELYVCEKKGLERLVAYSVNGSWRRQSKAKINLSLLPLCNNVGRKNASVAFDFFLLKNCPYSLVWEENRSVEFFAFSCLEDLKCSRGWLYPKAQGVFCFLLL